MALADSRATCATAIDLGDQAAPKGNIHPRPKQALGARLAAGALRHLFALGELQDSQGPVLAAARALPGPPSLAVSLTFLPPYDAPGALALAPLAPWPGLPNASACPPAVDPSSCLGLQVQDAATGAWWPAEASLSSDGGALLLSAPGAPSGARANATSNAWSCWPLVLLRGAQGLVPAYPWRQGLTA